MAKRALWVGVSLLAMGCSVVYTSTDGGVLDDAARADASIPTPSPEDAAPLPEASVADTRTEDADAGNEAPLRVFVTTASYKGSDLGQGTGGAIAEADRLCTGAARDFGLAGTFRAWLNTSQSLARDRVTALGPWYDAAGKQLVFARNPRTGQPPALAIPQPDGTPPPTSWFAWTGADSSGSLRATCSDWRSGVEVGRFGRPSSPATWADDNEQPCGDFRGHLYCFEVAPSI